MHCLVASLNTFSVFFLLFFCILLSGSFPCSIELLAKARANSPRLTLEMGTRHLPHLRSPCESSCLVCAYHKNRNQHFIFIRFALPSMVLQHRQHSQSYVVRSELFCNRFITHNYTQQHRNSENAENATFTSTMFRARLRLTLFHRRRNECKKKRRKFASRRGR